MKIKKSFSIEACLNGAKVETKNGHAVRILCTDARSSRPIIGLITENLGGKKQTESVTSWYVNGEWDLTGTDAYDLVIVETNEENRHSTLPDFPTSNFNDLARAQLIFNILTNEALTNLFNNPELENLKYELKRILLTNN